MASAHDGSGTLGVPPDDTHHDPGNINVAPAERVLSVLGGGALAAYGATRRTPGGGALTSAAIALTGGYLLYRGLTGRCALYTALRTGTAHHTDSRDAAIPHKQGVKVTRSVSINRPADELYRFWRDFENLPRFMNHLESVTVQGDTRSHWVAKGPLGKAIEWDAQVIGEQQNERIAWRSLEGADVSNAGSVWFKALPEGRGTEVKVTLEYNPPAGVLGAAVAKLWGEEPGQQVADDLRRFKQVMEAGEIVTTEGQPSGRA